MSLLTDLFKQTAASEDWKRFKRAEDYWLEFLKTHHPELHAWGSRECLACEQSDFGCDACSKMEDESDRLYQDFMDRFHRYEADNGAMPNLKTKGELS